MTNIGIIEDNPADLDNLKNLLETYAIQKGYPVKLDSFASGEEFLSSKRRGYDLIFMDMQLGGMDGIETSRKLRESNPDVVIVIVTSLMQYAIRGYSIKASDYLLKPLEYDRFAEKMDEFCKLIQNKRKYIVIKTENGLTKIRISAIAFLEVFGHRLYMVHGGKRERVISTLSKMESELAPYGFAKCNKCYLVNLAMVEGIYGDDVEVSGSLLKISRREKADFIQKLTRFAEG